MKLKLLCIRFVQALVAAALLAASSASAFGITDVSAMLGESHSPDDKQTHFGGVVTQGKVSELGIVSAPALVGGGSPSESFTTKLSMSNFGRSTAQGFGYGSAILVDYQILFTVNDPLAIGYSIRIDAARIGAFTVGEMSGPAAVSFSAGEILATLNGSPVAELGFPEELLGYGGNRPLNSLIDVPVSQTGAALISGSGTQTFALGFTWTQQISGAPYSASEPTIRLTESAARFGLSSGADEIGLSDEYPGIGNRDPSQDGHIVRVTATLVPEPATAILLGGGLLVLGLRGDRGLGRGKRWRCSM